MIQSRFNITNITHFFIRCRLMLLICFFICFLILVMMGDHDEFGISEHITCFFLSSICAAILYNNFLVWRDGVFNFEAVDSFLELWWSFGYWLFKLTPELSGNWWKMLYWIICFPICTTTLIRWCFSILGVYNYLFLRE